MCLADLIVKNKILKPCRIQSLGVDVVEATKTKAGNHDVLVFRNIITKWPMVFQVPNQRASQLVKLLVNSILPFCGVPEALLWVLYDLLSKDVP